jgi:hypothetical protein
VGGDFRILLCFNLTAPYFTSMVQDCQAQFRCALRRPARADTIPRVRARARKRRLDGVTTTPRARVYEGASESCNSRARDCAEWLGKDCFAKSLPVISSGKLQFCLSREHS